MAGIVSYGAYVPIYRLGREEIGRTWEKRTSPGEKAIANWDEDSITMGVEAAVDCLKDTDRESVDALYFASTTPPYRVKQSASIVAAAADLREELLTIDFTDSLRAGTNAMRAASDAVDAGSAKRVLVVASDMRVPPPNSEFETDFGDGAAAFLIGDSNTAVEIEGSYTISSEFIDVWKRDEDTYVRTWEDRFVIEEGYLKILPRAVSGLMKKYNLEPKDFTRAVFYAPNARRHTQIARNLGFDAKTQVQDPMFAAVGDTGAAFAPMMLVAALEEAKPGDRIMFANYSDGADAYVLRVTDNIEKVRDRRGIKRHLTSKMMIPTYGTYLRMRSLMEWEDAPKEVQLSALTILWRDRKWVIRGRAHKCRKCGNVQYPMQLICMYCQAKGEFDEIRISDKKGTLYTFSMEERAPVIFLPNVVSVVDLEGGGRFYSSMTDRDPEKIDVGMQMELTFRNIHEGSGIHNYFWKTRPVRC